MGEYDGINYELREFDRDLDNLEKEKRESERIYSRFEILDIPKIVKSNL